MTPYADAPVGNNALACVAEAAPSITVLQSLDSFLLLSYVIFTWLLFPLILYLVSLSKHY